METNDARDVVEAVVCTFLCTAAVALCTWLGKRFLDLDTSENISVYINNAPLPMEEVEPDECE